MRNSNRCPIERLDVQCMLAMKPVDRLKHLQTIRVVQLAQSNFVFDHLPQVDQHLTLLAPRHRVHRAQHTDGFAAR
jgi:hypothetical protein